MDWTVVFPRIGWVVLAALLVTATAGSRCAAATEQPPVPQQTIDALKSLKKADAAKRQGVYDLLSRQGDARLIPALKAYRDGTLQLRDGRLVVYGDRITLPGQGSVLPLIDAISLQPILDKDGKPITVPKLDLSNAVRPPPRSERGAIGDLVSTLALLDPDPDARIASIRDAGERAARALIDPAVRDRYIDALRHVGSLLPAMKLRIPPAAEALRAVDAALAQRPAGLLAAAPDSAAVGHVTTTLKQTQDALPKAADGSPADAAISGAIADVINAGRDYQDALDARAKTQDELPRFSTAVHRQLDADPNGRFAPALKEAVAEMDAVLGDHATQLKAVEALKHLGTSRAASLLERVVYAARAAGDTELQTAASDARCAAHRYQAILRFVQNTFAGLSLGSILVLLALGLSIIFGLMGVINMAHGEFMMVGAFTTFVVSQFFQQHLPRAYDYYLIAAVPAAFLVAAFVGFLCEWLVIRHLYGRPLETLLATWGIGLILIQAARVWFGDNQSVRPPHWMEGGVEVAPDLTFPLNRIYIIVFCLLCIGAVYFIVNRTKLGLLLRATTQNRPMASALGVTTRWVDAITFSLGAGLAGLAGVAVPLYNKINPSIGQEYIVDSFMVVVVGGVGKLAGAIVAGLGLGFLSKYLEPILSSIPSLESGASVIGKVLVLGLIVLFLQRRPAGLFPPKGRVADA